MVALETRRPVRDGEVFSAFLQRARARSRAPIPLPCTTYGWPDRPASPHLERQDPPAPVPRPLSRGGRGAGRAGVPGGRARGHGRYDHARGCERGQVYRRLGDTDGGRARPVHGAGGDPALRNGVSPLALWAFTLCYLVSAIGVEIGFHRYFSHRAFKCHPAVRWVLGVSGSTAGQGPVLYWAATHRQHHRFTDTEHDPHAPLPHGLAGWWQPMSAGCSSPQRGDLPKAIPDLLNDRTTLQISRLYFVWFGLGLALPFGAGLALQGWGGALDAFLWGGQCGSSSTTT